MEKSTAFAGLLACLLLNACSPGKSSQSTILTDSTTLAAGQLLFDQDCSSCHNFEADGIGPSLGGITTSTSVDWIKTFIKNPQGVIESGDERAARIYERFKTFMPGFAQYPDDKLDALISFLDSRKVTTPAEEPEDPNELKDPIPGSIAMSDLVVDLKLITQIPFSSDEDPKTRIVKLGNRPGSENLFVLDLRGKLYRLADDYKPEVYFDMAKERAAFINKPGLATGFGSFAFHPEFEKNGLLYTSHTEPPKTKTADFHYADSIPVTLQWVVTEWTTKDPGAATFSGTGRELLRIDMVSGIHGMQELTFNPLARRGSDDYGLLYIGIGDGGAVENKFPFLVRRHDKLWGTIIRIDPKGKNSVNKQYGIPSQNPFVRNGPTEAGEIYAYGFRNPHKLTWTKDGKMLSSNIGHGHIESFNLVLPGHDYGWPIREGTFIHLEYGDMNRVYPLTADDSLNHITYPVIQYDHDEGKAMSSGYEYWGKDLPDLKGKFFYADINNGRLFFSRVDELQVGKIAPINEWKVTLNGKPATMDELCGNKRVDLRLGRDGKGELYLFAKPDGKLYKMVKAKHSGKLPV